MQRKAVVRQDRSLRVLDQVKGARPKAIIRAAGDRFVMMEYGDMTADIINRCRIEHLIRKLEKTKTSSGIVDLNPNLHSVTIHFDTTPTPKGRPFWCKKMINTNTGMEHLQ
jgi:hypothetical protein